MALAQPKVVVYLEVQLECVTAGKASHFAYGIGVFQGTGVVRFEEEVLDLL